MSKAVTIPKTTITGVTRTILSDVEARFNDLMTTLGESGSFDEEALRKIVVPTADEISGLFKAGKVSGKRYRDPAAPKKPLSAYMLWLKENRDDIKTDLEENGVDLTGRSAVTEVAKKAGELWKELDEETKQPFIDQAEELSKAYNEAKEDYQPKYKADKVRFLDLPVDKTPEGWEGPYKNQTIHKFAVGRKPGIGNFNTFAEAVVEAEKLIAGGAQVGGITRDKNGYGLRKTTRLINDDTTADYVSWIFTESKGKFTEKPKVAKAKKPKAEKPKAEKKSKKAEKPKAEKKSKKAPKKSKAAVLSVSIAPQPVDMGNDMIEVETVRFGSKPEAEKVVEEVVEVVEEADVEVVEEVEVEEVAEEFDAETDEEEETLELVEITIDGEDYYHDENTDEIYSIESEEVIGTFKDGKLVLNE